VFVLVRESSSLEGSSTKRSEGPCVRVKVGESELVSRSAWKGRGGEQRGHK